MSASGPQKGVSDRKHRELLVRATEAVVTPISARKSQSEHLELESWSSQQPTSEHGIPTCYLLFDSAWSWYTLRLQRWISVRDDFSAKTIRTLAARVGYHCSNPACVRSTSGPALDHERTVNIGVGAHITAAAEGGKRYDPNMSPTERSSGANGICCARAAQSSSIQMRTTTRSRCCISGKGTRASTHSMQSRVAIHSVR